MPKCVTATVVPTADRVDVVILLIGADELIPGAILLPSVPAVVFETDGVDTVPIVVVLLI